MSVGSRREARETALGLLYEADVRGVRPGVVLAAQVIDPPEYTSELVAGVDRHLDEIDAWLRAASREWSLERMAVLDRCLLRLGAYELAHRPDVPTGAVLSEAVELASRYSTDDSGRFVNGVLASLARELRPEPEPRILGQKRVAPERPELPQNE